MRRGPLSVLVVLGLGVVQAQSYFGAALTVRSAATEIGVVPLLGVQVGGPVLENLHLRAQFDTFLLASTLAADVLYRFDVGGGAHLYLGGGLELFITTLLGFNAWPGAHGTLGFGYTPGNVGYVLEAQPFTRIAEAGIALDSVRFRAGANLYF